MLRIGGRMVTTLPITPNVSGRFQTLLGIFIAWSYATFTQEPGFLALNLTGERLVRVAESELTKLIQS